MNKQEAFEMAQARANRLQVRYEVWEHTGDWGHRDGDIVGTHAHRIAKSPVEFPRGWTFIGLVDPDRP